MLAWGFIALRFVVAPLVPCLLGLLVGDIARLRGNRNGARQEQPGFLFVPTSSRKRGRPPKQAPSTDFRFKKRRQLGNVALDAPSLIHREHAVSASSRVSRA